MKNIVEIIRREYNMCYLMGDYNINLLNVDTHQLTSDFNDTLFSNGFVPMITGPTRVTPNSATLIDNILTNQLNNNNINNVMRGILITDISDHHPIFNIKNVVNYVEMLKSTLTGEITVIEIKWNFKKVLHP